MALYFMNFEYRASLADFASATAAGAIRATSPGLTRPSFTRSLFEFRLCGDTLLCNLRRPSSTSRLYGSGGHLFISFALTRKAQFHQRTLLYRVLSSPSALQFQRAELHQQACNCCTGGGGAVLYIITWRATPTDFAPVVVSTASAAFSAALRFQGPRQKLRYISNQLGMSPVALVHAGPASPASDCQKG